MSRRPQNNVAKLAPEVRYLIAQALVDGTSTYDQIRAIPEVARECAARGITLHNNSFKAYSATAEYAEFRQRLLAFAGDLERRKMAAFLLGQQGGAATVADVATYELLQQILAKLQAGDALDAQELARIGGALAAYQRNRLAAGNQSARRAAEAREAQLRSRIAELEDQLAALQANGGGQALSGETLAEIETKMGLL